MKHNRLPLLAQRVLNTPLALHPGKAELIMSALGDRFGVAVVNPRAMEDIYEFDNAGPPGRETPYDLLQGVAIIPICGNTVQKNYSIRPYSGMTGYDGVRHAMACALADKQARAIMLEIDSPGGEVHGLFDLVDDIYAARGQKPIWAMVNENAFSAGYALASAAERIVTPRTGGVGSIGIIAIYTEISGMLKREGVTVNIIQFGARKADGNSFQALPAEARDRFQAQINSTGALFTNTVARNRGMSPEKITDMEAACFLAAEAKTNGLIDDVMSADECFEALLASL